MRRSLFEKPGRILNPVGHQNIKPMGATVCQIGRQDISRENLVPDFPRRPPERIIVEPVLDDEITGVRIGDCEFELQVFVRPGRWEAEWSGRVKNEGRRLIHEIGNGRTAAPTDPVEGREKNRNGGAVKRLTREHFRGQRHNHRPGRKVSVRRQRRKTRSVVETEDPSISDVFENKRDFPLAQVRPS